MEVEVMVKQIDITGKKFSRLTPICVDNSKRPKGSTRAYWKCECECGKETIVSGSDLRSGKVKSCGCLHDEMAHKRFYKHGMSNTKLDWVLGAMKQRCNNIHNIDYPNYGGRGIKICDEWLNDSSEFFSWALSHGYEEGLSIDRIDVNGNYEPSNCRWVTMKVQANNKNPKHLFICKNARSDSKSKIRGVSFDKSKNAWVATFNFNNKRVLQKVFKKKQEAIDARQEAEKKYQEYV